MHACIVCRDEMVRLKSADASGAVGDGVHCLSLVRSRKGNFSMLVTWRMDWNVRDVVWTKAVAGLLCLGVRGVEVFLYVYRGRVRFLHILHTKF